MKKRGAVWRWVLGGVIVVLAAYAILVPMFFDDRGAAYKKSQQTDLRNLAAMEDQFKRDSARTPPQTVRGRKAVTAGEPVCD